MPSFEIGRKKGVDKLTPEQFKKPRELAPENSQVKKRAQRADVKLPKIQKEELTLVQKILQEMGCSCGMKKHKTPEEIAEKHGKSVDYINKQLKSGIKVEHEHTTDEHEAETIALQHLSERPDYYERLKKVEKVDEANKEDPCWDGYEQVGMKKKGKKKVPNCVPVKESFRLPAQNGQLLHILHSWRGKTLATQLFFPAGKVPNRREVADAINKVYPDSKLLSYRVGNFAPDQPLIQVANTGSKNYLLNNGTIGESAAWTRKEGQNKEGGLNEKGRKSYEKENPGSDLKPPQPEGGPRKDSYCARSKGQQQMHNIDCSKTPEKRICLARKKWNC